jgi:tetratricopeptide (TPR) repeat protein
MTTEFIPDDDQLQIFVAFVIESCLENREGLDQTIHILVRANPARIKDERIEQLITFEDFALIFAACISGEAFIEGIVNHRYAIRFEIEDVDQVVARRVGNRKHPARGFHGALRSKVDSVLLETRDVLRRKLHMNAVVDGDHLFSRRQEKSFVMRNVNHVGMTVPDEERQREVFPPARGRDVAAKVREVRTQLPELLKVACGSDQQIFVPLVHLGQIADEVPDVRSHTELINSADVDCNTHELCRGNYNENRMRRIFSSFLILAAALILPSAVFAQQSTVLVNTFENQTSDRNLQWLGEGLAALISERLTAQPQLYVFGLDERMIEYDKLGIPDTVSVSRATAMRIAWDMGADVIVTGKFSGSHDEFRIDARVLNIAEGSSALDVSATGKLDDVISMAASLSAQLAKGLVPGAEVPESDYASRPPVPRSAFEAYVRGILVSDPQRKIDLLKDAIRLHPQYTEAIYQLGQAYYLDSNFKSSAELLDKVSAVAPEYPQARFMLAMDQYHLGDFTKSATMFSALPANYDVLVNLGAALLGKGDAVGAETAWRRASAANPKGTEATFNMAYAAFARGEMETAVTRLTQFLRSTSRDAEALFLLGQAYEKLGRTNEAQRVTAQALRQSPRLEKWVGQPIPPLARLRNQFNATELRRPFEASIWTEPRLARKAAAQDASDILNGRRQ